MKIAVSVCPNDILTYSYFLIHPSKFLEIDLFPLGELNHLLDSQKYDAIKVSATCLRPPYRFIPVGSSFSMESGPILVLSDQKAKRVATPCLNATSTFLVNHFFKDLEVFAYPLDQIYSGILDRSLEGGILITPGMHQIPDGFVSFDLGTMWRDKYGFPIPLGVVGVHDRIGIKEKDALKQAISFSQTWGQMHLDQVIALAQRWSPDNVDVLPHFKFSGQKLPNPLELLEKFFDIFSQGKLNILTSS